MLPIAWNRYLYCRNDPVNYLDPDGNNRVYWRNMLQSNDAKQWGSALGMMIGGSLSSSTGKGSILGVPMIIGDGALMFISYTDTHHAFKLGREVSINVIASRLSTSGLFYNEQQSQEEKWETALNTNLITPEDLEKMKTFGADQEDILAAIQTILKDCER